MSKTLTKEKHGDFLIKLMNDRSSFEYWMTLPIRTNNYYWGLCALYLFGQIDRINRDEVIDYLLQCQKPDGGFSGNVGHDASIHTTLSAIQSLIILDAFDKVDIEKNVQWIASLQ